ncbi:MAG: hypothetical protein IPM46_11355 [Flavobacteriales bacterium]|nr:hypothetical protein [Flavobacteriales bacterium]
MKRQAGSSEVLIHYLDSLEEHVLRHRTIQEKLSKALDQPLFADASKGGTDLGGPPRGPNQEPAVRSKALHVLSAALIWMLVAVFIPFTTLKDEFQWAKLLNVVFAVLLLAGFSWLNIYLLGLVPIIYGLPWINYLLNATVQLTFLAVIIQLSSKRKP